MDNKFQWGRMDEIIIFALALGFLLLLSIMNMPAEAIMTMGGSLMTLVPIYIKSALERNNGNGSEKGNPVFYPNGLPMITDTPPAPAIKSPKHHLRESE